MSTILDACKFPENALKCYKMQKMTIRMCPIKKILGVIKPEASVPKNTHLWGSPPTTQKLSPLVEHFSASTMSRAFWTRNLIFLASKLALQPGLQIMLKNASFSIHFSALKWPLNLTSKNTCFWSLFFGPIFELNFCLKKCRNFSYKEIQVRKTASKPL